MRLDNPTNVVGAAPAAAPAPLEVVPPEPAPAPAEPAAKPPTATLAPSAARRAAPDRQRPAEATSDDATKSALLRQGEIALRKYQSQRVKLADAARTAAAVLDAARKAGASDREIVKLSVMTDVDLDEMESDAIG